MNNQNLKNDIASIIKTNGNGEITGALMQSVLFSIINHFGSGAIFRGVATPTSVPIQTDVNGFYLASEKGTYVNFGGFQNTEGKLIVFSNLSGNGYEKIFEYGIKIANEFNALNNSDAVSAKQINDYLVELGLVSSETTYKFYDDFSTNKGWIADPTYPITPNISGGILSLPFTNGQNEAIRINIPQYVSGETLKIKLRYRVLTTNGTKISVGCSFGSSVNPLFEILTPTTQWQEVTATATANSTNTVFYIASNASLNKGDTVELDFIIINEKENTGIKNYEPVLGNLSEELISAISPGGAVYLKPITYTATTPISIPSNTILKGVKGKTKIVFTGTGDLFALNQTKENITIEDVIIEGNTSITPTTITPTDVKAKTGIGTNNAIVVNGFAKNITIKGCEILKFNGCGIKLIQTHTGSYVRTMKILNNVVTNCYLGILFDTRAEYHQIIGNSFCYNKIGAWIEGGNNAGATNHFNANGVGVVVSGIGANNDTHGSISASLINHNLSYSIFAVTVNNGYTFNGCHCFEGNIYIENSRGIVFNGGMIAAQIQIVNENAGYNIFSNNIFVKSYGGGTITGSPTKLSLNGNRFMDGSVSTTINNSI